MSKPSIVVDKLGKQYKIGLRHTGERTFREAVVGAVAQPFRRLRSLGETPHGQDTLWALKDVSFESRAGEVVGVIGRNGAGKSTLLKVLSRITEPTTGRGELRGRVGSLLEVGTGFHPELTGRENIYLNGTILGMKKAEIDRKFDQIVAFAEIETFLDTPVKRYSSGMYVRLAFAVAAHLEPEILLIDEVLAVGDAAFQKKCLGKIGEVARQGRTVLLVSHNMGPVMELAERCLLLNAGRIEMDGPPAETVGRYLRAGTSSDLSRDLTGVPRTGAHSRDFALTHVRMLNATDGVMRYKTPMEIELRYTCSKRLTDVVIGLVVKNFFGGQLIHCRSTDAGLKLSTKEHESGCVRIQVASQHLPPGQYVLTLAAFIPENHALDLVPDALPFDVEVDTTDIEDPWILNKAGMGFRLPSTWQAVETDSLLEAAAT